MVSDPITPRIPSEAESETPEGENTNTVAHPTDDMPLLQFDTDLRLSTTEKERIVATVTELYTTEMQTTEGHVAVTIRERAGAEMRLGRSEPGSMVFLDADIRRGRPFESKRSFAIAVMEFFESMFDVPEPNMKVVFTEHPGGNMMGMDRVGSEWDGD